MSSAEENSQLAPCYTLYRITFHIGLVFAPVEKIAVFIPALFLICIVKSLRIIQKCYTGACRVFCLHLNLFAHGLHRAMH